MTQSAHWVYGTVTLQEAYNNSRLVPHARGPKMGCSTKSNVNKPRAGIIPALHRHYYLISRKPFNPVGNRRRFRVLLAETI